MYRYPEIIRSNTFKLTRTFKDWDAWYNGTTGINIIDTEIQKANKYGWSHHIIRLMVFLNIMILLEIRPDHIYKWFMEVVPMDAYDWVMKSNIYCMGYFYDKAMVKVYISTSNYLRRMSNYKFTDCDTQLWDVLFYTFLKKHKYSLTAGNSVYLRNLSREPKHKAKGQTLSIPSPCSANRGLS